jgi:hypothetical protein
VRYLAILAAGAFIYSFGPFSLLHGVMYALIPKLWLAREASRFVYLADFAVALLAAFGTHFLFGSSRDETEWKGLTRIFTAIAAVCALVLLVPALLGQPNISPWTFLSILTIMAVYGLYRRIIRGNTGVGMRALIMALLLCDIGAFNWTAATRIEAATAGDQLERALSAGPAMNFLKLQPGLFRVDFPVEPGVNLGDLYGVEMIQNGGVATFTNEYTDLRGRPDLLNGSFVLRPASAPEPGAVY